MTDITLRSDVDVELVEVSASDLRVAKAAWVSTKGKRAEDEANEERIAGLIGFLMRDRHGSPFEHTSFTFAIRCPIFVVREFHRHRAGWCLAGDTEIWQESWGTGDKPQRTIKKRPISELWDNWHNGVPDSLGRRRRGLPSVRNFRVRTMDEASGKFILSRVTNIYKNEPIQMHLVTLENGMSIKTSINHLFWTDYGWRKLDEINVGDTVGVNGRVYEESGKMTAGVNWSKVVSIRTMLVEDSYDIELEGPNRGFVANGFVVHNSYNEESGRYSKLQPEFYTPTPDRNLVQTGKPGHYVFGPGNNDQIRSVKVHIEANSQDAWRSYETMLENGVAKEVARMVLPLNIYTSFYATCNARSLMHFLGLRTENTSATYVSHPQKEIQMVADKMEAHFKEVMPLTWTRWNEYGRVAP